MKNLLALAAAVWIAAPAAIAAAEPADEPAPKPAYSEARLDSDGVFHSSADNGGRSGARYQAGSTSKFACSLLALDLERDGKLRLDDNLADLLPGYAARDAGAITLRNLLQNRSGIADGLMESFREDAPAVAALDISPLEAANRFAIGRTDDAPGTAFDYVNTNWIVVQAVLERAGGAPLADLMQARIFDPADMSTAVIMTDGQLPGSAPVTTEEPVIRIPDFVLCAGGLAATPADLIRLARFAHHAGAFSADMLEDLETVASPESHYALGGRVRQVKVGGEIRTIHWESGSNGPFKSYTVYDPVADVGYAVMTNEDAYEFIGERRDRWVREELGGELLE